MEATEAEPRIAPYHFHIIGCNLLPNAMFDHYMPDMPGYYPGGLCSKYFQDAKNMHQVQQNKLLTQLFLQKMLEITSTHANNARGKQNLKLLDLQWSACFEQAVALLQQPQLFARYAEDTQKYFMQVHQEQMQAQIMQGSFLSLEPGDIAICCAVLDNFTMYQKPMIFPNADHDLLINVLDHKTEDGMVHFEIIKPYTWLPQLQTTQVTGIVQRENLVVLLNSEKRKQTHEWVRDFYGKDLGVGRHVQVWRHPRAPWFNGLEVEILEYDFDRAAWLVGITSNACGYKGIQIMLEPQFTDAQLRHGKCFLAQIHELKGHRLTLLNNINYLLGILDKRNKKQKQDLAPEPETQAKEPETQGMQLETQGMEPETEGMQLETQGMEPETQGMQLETQGMKTQEMQTETPKKTQDAMVCQDGLACLSDVACGKAGMCIFFDNATVDQNANAKAAHMQLAQVDKDKAISESKQLLEEIEQLRQKMLQEKEQFACTIKEKASSEKQELLAEIAQLKQKNAEMMQEKEQLRAKLEQTTAKLEQTTAKHQEQIAEEYRSWKLNMHAEIIDTQRKVKSSLLLAFNKNLKSLGYVATETDFNISLEKCSPKPDAKGAT